MLTIKYVLYKKVIYNIINKDNSYKLLFKQIKTKEIKIMKNTLVNLRKYLEFGFDIIEDLAENVDKTYKKYLLTEEEKDADAWDKAINEFNDFTTSIWGALDISERKAIELLIAR